MEEVFKETFLAEDHQLLFDQIMTEYGQDVLELVYSYVKNKTDAEDLTQEIFVKCYQSLNSFDRRSTMKTWLWRIAINHCKDYLKSWHVRKVQAGYTDEWSGASTNDYVEREVIQKDERQRVMEATLGLPIQYRELIYLHYYEELTIKEISEIINVNQNTIKTRLKRAKELLQGALRRSETWKNS
ncbi:sigma-70 family RNA polymerase sigma factor [Bacillus xiapuensis]|uniref:sigma-70 family RNA polymerase sigma factor n=1 Tax=Bacillus xiapuensis TaxID=2014075 RepID=UPI000C246096|nr:sigma-70 family RNA polymerase sigma factor [Bacillus xiapuensis]